MNPLDTQRELGRGPDFPELLARPEEKELPPPDVEHLITAGESRKAIRGTVEKQNPKDRFYGQGCA